MTPTIRIVETKLWHCGQMARRMRRAHMEAYALVGMDPHRSLREIISLPGMSRSIFIDGELSAMFGCVGVLMAPVGGAWVVFTEKAIYQHTRALLQITRDQLAGMLKIHGELTTLVLAGDDAALRFLAYMGWHVCHDDPRGEAQHTAKGRHGLVEFAKSTPDFREPVGRGYGIRMGLHPEEEPCV